MPITCDRQSTSVPVQNHRGRVYSRREKLLVCSIGGHKCSWPTLDSVRRGSGDDACFCGDNRGFNRSADESVLAPIGVTEKEG